MRIVSNPAALAPRELKLARGDSGHGCIRCGCTIFVYCTTLGDNARQGPFLLCTPCVALLSTMAENAKVLAVLRDHPLPLQKAFDRRPLPYVEGLNLPDTRFAFGAEMRQTVMPVVFGGSPVVALEPPEAPGGPVRLTIMLGDGEGDAQTIVHQNGWRGAQSGWRFDRRPGRYLFASADGEASLVLAFPGDGMVLIESLRSRAGPHLLEMDARCARLDGTIIRIPNVESRMVGVRLSAP